MLTSPIIEITFGPAWWNHYYGMDFGNSNSWHDPVKATEREREQRKLLFERFGDVGPGTDLQLTRQAYPNAKISAYFDPAGFSSLTQDKVDAIVSKTIKAAAPVDKITFIRAIEVGPELSDDSVRAMMTVFERINISGGTE